MLRNKSPVTSHQLPVRIKRILLLLFLLSAIRWPEGRGLASDSQSHYPLSANLLAQEQFKYDSHGKRDPFIPLVTSDGRLINLETIEKKGDLKLEGIIYDENGLSYAIVNGMVAKIGDKIEDNQVLKIQKNKIIFIKDGSIFELRLKEEEQK